MARQNPGKKVSSANNAILPRLPNNPSRVDRLIVDSLKEHAKVCLLYSEPVVLHVAFKAVGYRSYASSAAFILQVSTLLLKMEGLNEKLFHANIHSAMDGWLDSVRKVQARRKEEIINATNRHRSGAPRNHDERGMWGFAFMPWPVCSWERAEDCGKFKKLSTLNSPYMLNYYISTI